MKSGYIRWQYRNVLPSNQQNSDLYIVEFPKSGITWFSTLVSNVNLIMSGSSQRASYYNIQQLVPDIHMGRELMESPIWTVPKCRFIKSHAMYCPYYQHVIYLVRNPVSVMKSYYHYKKMLGHFEKTFEAFVIDERYGLERWKQHVASWLFRGDSAQRIHLVKYEDLIGKPRETIKELYANLGFDLDDETIDNAIELSNFEHMKESENHYKKYNPNTSLVFVRDGKAQAEVDEEVRTKILSSTDAIREKLGY